MATKLKTKTVPALEQLGFGFEVCDAQGNQPGFLHERAEVYAALDLIQQAQWASVDVETTGLTDASSPVTLDMQQWREGASAKVRMRTIQARVPTLRGRSGPRKNFAFDCDRMGPALTREVAQTLLSRRMFIAHNAGFDLYWLRHAEGRVTMPAMVVDSMLLTRLLRPELVLKRAELISSIRHIREVPEASPLAQAAWKSLIGGASGGSLADVVLALFDQVVDKTYQKPTNWTGLLGFEHYDYAIDDVVWADRILCELLEVEPDAGDLFQAYLGQRARKSTVRLIEPQVPELVLLREHGMPLNTRVGYSYVTIKRDELADKVDELIRLEPALEPHRSTLANPDAGLDDALKQALAQAFEDRGVVLRRTAATGAPQVGEKDLRACKAVNLEASRPLFDAWVAVSRSKKASAMALEVCGFAERGPDGRGRSLLSHGPVTGRLSASEPNCFTGDTEILTEQGWTRFDALQDTQRVAQYDHGIVSLVHPLGHIREFWVGDLVYNKTTRIDLLTTPKHRCLLLNPKTGVAHVKEAQDYKEGYLQLHAAMYQGGAGLPLSDREIQFLVMMQADGSWHDSGIDIKFTKQRKITRLRELFGAEVGHSYDTKFGQTRFRFNKASPLTGMAQKYLGPRKEFGDWIYQMTRAQLDVFVNELAFWDGLYTRKDTSIAYTTTTEINAHWVQIAYSLSGKTTRVVPYRAWNSKKQAWRVQGFHKPHTYTTNRTQTRQAFEGMVYCVTVPSGFIMVRRNGCVMVTGQCQQWPRDQLFRAMCMSLTKPGCETLDVLVTELNQPLLAKVSGRPVAPGETAKVESAWLAALFASDKEVPDWPQDERQALSDRIEDQFSHRIVASDFGALDVRVGAALCIRSQREMLALAEGHAVPGPVQPPEKVVQTIRDVTQGLRAGNPELALTRLMESYGKLVDRLTERMEALKADLDAERIQRNRFFKLRGELKDELLAARLGWRLAQCLALGAARGESEYSALRDAFVAEIDIHTFTGMKLAGRDPMKEFEGLTPAARKKREKVLRKELGPRRQQGKIANLSLLYGMMAAGFQEAAARVYNEHWTLREAEDIRALWMNAYPEVELWRLWTECLQVGVVYVPEQGKEKPVRTGWWMARTQAGREIVALGLNAALSYQDQSTGADILGLIMHRFWLEYPHIFNASINQVHDEIVFEVLAENFAHELPIIESVMVEEANSLLMPYGVPAAVSPACGVLWIKD